MTAKIIQFKPAATPRQAVRKAINKVFAREKRQHRDEVRWKLLKECRGLGQPDMKVLNKLIKDWRLDQLTDWDIMAIYLYRKKLRDG